MGLRVRLFTLWEVRGGWELGCWLLTRKRFCTPRIGGSKYRWSWIMITYHIHTTHIHTTYIQNCGDTVPRPSFRTFDLLSTRIDTTYIKSKDFSSGNKTHNFQRQVECQCITSGFVVFSFILSFFLELSHDHRRFWFSNHISKKGEWSSYQHVP